MRKLACLALGVASIFVVGCGSGSSQPSEAQMHKMLDGPPSLEGMANKHPKGAKEGLKGAGGGAPAAQPQAGGQ